MHEKTGPIESPGSDIRINVHLKRTLWVSRPLATDKSGIIILDIDLFWRGNVYIIDSCCDAWGGGTLASMAP